MASKHFAAFRAAPHTLGPTPGVREAWHRGRRRYAVWLGRVNNPAVLARLDEAGHALRDHGVVPFAEPHLTVFVAGFPAAAVTHDDDVDEGALAAQERAVRHAAPPAPRLVVGGLDAFVSCPFLRVADPHGDLVALRALLAPHAREVRFSPYVPHLTVGLFGDDRPTGPVAAAIAPLRRLPPIPLRLDVLELVELDAVAIRPTLATRVALPLGDTRR